MLPVATRQLVSRTSRRRDALTLSARDAVRTCGLDSRAHTPRNAFGRIVSRRLSPTIETRPALFEPIRASRSSFHQRRIHRRRLAYDGHPLARSRSARNERLPCATRSEKRPTNLCNPIFSKKRTRNCSTTGAAVAFAASAPMTRTVHAVRIAVAVCIHERG